MPLHDWASQSEWDGVHLLWLTELLRWIKPRLPRGYRAFVGTAPVVGIGSLPGRPDVGVATTDREPRNVPPPPALAAEPDEQAVALAAVDPGRTIYVERAGGLIAAIGLISPRNKDRPSSRQGYTAAYAGYLQNGIHLLLIDVHPKPYGFSFADSIAEEMQIEGHKPLPCPQAVAYRVGGPTPTGGRYIDLWRRQLVTGQPLPEMVLPISLDAAVTVDLEQTYARAAADADLP